MQGSVIVRRSLSALASLTKAPSSIGPDRSVHVPAMAEYIRMTGTQIALPTLVALSDGETLVDGSRLVAALQQADWRAPVQCLLRRVVAHGDADAAPFTPKRAAAAGTDAVLVTLDHPLPKGDEERWLAHWAQRPTEIDHRHFGWPSVVAAFGQDDWIGFVHRLEADHDEHVPIVALNGRYPTWVRQEAQ